MSVNPKDLELIKNLTQRVASELKHIDGNFEGRVSKDQRAFKLDPKKILKHGVEKPLPVPDEQIPSNLKNQIPPDMPPPPVQSSVSPQVQRPQVQPVQQPQIQPVQRPQIQDEQLELPFTPSNPLFNTLQRMEDKIDRLQRILNKIEQRLTKYEQC